MIWTSKLSPALGLEVIGFDFKTQLSKKIINEIKKLVLKHKIIVFRDQRLTQKEQIYNCSLFGKIVPHPLSKSLCDYKEMTIISNLNKDGHFLEKTRPDFNLWHNDLCYNLKIPNFTFLYAESIPEKGGNTLFSDTTKAYDDLNFFFKKKLNDYHAIFSFSDSLIRRCKRKKYQLKIRDEDKKQGCVHPIIRVHPVSKQKSIFANWTYTDKIIELSLEESDKLLSYLFEYYTQDKYIYSHKYQNNDLVLWDNNALMHSADNMTPLNGPRIMHRIVIE